MDVLNTIHDTLQGTSRLTFNTSTLGKLEGRTIGQKETADLLTRVVSRQIGKSLLSRITFTSDINCIRNPFSRRYENPDNTGTGNFNYGLPDSPMIGQLYDVYEREGNVHEFLDRTVAGDLMGYTHLEQAAEDRSENAFLDKLFTVSTYNNFIDPERYLNDVPLWVNKNITPRRYTPREPYAIFPLTTYPVSVAPNGEVQIYNNLFEIYTTDDGPMIHEPIINDSNFTGETLERYTKDVEYFYQENKKSSAGGNVSLNTDSNNDEFATYEVIDVSGDNLKNINGLLGKTNKLFNDGKIGTLINRFKTDIENGENRTSLLNTSTDRYHGLSRGRNLTKPEKTTHNGYDNPYCRVWTSHHRYSKYTDLIRPLNGVLLEDAGATEDGKTAEHYFSQGDGFRPFGGNKRLYGMSSLDFSNKLPKPRITPTRHNGVFNKDDIKRCMFSIENLAWKDLNFKAQVIGVSGESTDYTYGNVLSREQRGPNNGRIMWFPPYNLKFQENVSATWNDNLFIGRGEPIKTYANAQRRGTLSFTLLVDHPMIVNQWKMANGDTIEDKEKKDLDFLRYFAGCGPLDIKVEKNVKYNTITNTETGLTFNKNEEVVDIDLETGEAFFPAEPVPETVEQAPDITFQTIFFFPNNYSGIDYEADKAMEELFRNGKRPRNGITGYELTESNVSGLTFDNGGLNGQTYTTTGGQWNGQHPYYFGANRYGEIQSWYYQVNYGKSTDKETAEKLPDKNRYDSVSYGLNYGAFGGDSFYENAVNRAYLLGFSGNSVDWDSTLNTGLTAIKTMLGSHIKDLRYVIPSYFVYTGGIKDIVKYLEENITPRPKYKIKASCIGYASVDGYGNLNQTLSTERANTVANWFKKYSGLEVELGEINGNGQLDKGPSVSAVEGKVSRCAILTIELISDKSVAENKPNITSDNSGSTVYKIEPEKLTFESYDAVRVTNEITKVDTKEELTTYDDEFQYFEDIKMEDPIIRKRICDKVKYFDPAFHSISPEGFNARLTFLQQCLRQGPTIAASDNENGSRTMGAGNLSFGRPPFCVLRIGDFYNTKICIDSLTIQYDNEGGVQWDLNPEGIGLQPMFANIDLSFTFLGGSDLSGPIDRLQNAVTHNYYANTSIYERRSDFRDDFKDENDIAYTWEPTLTNGTEAEDLSLHIKYSSDKKKREELENGQISIADIINKKVGTKETGRETILTGLNETQRDRYSEMDKNGGILPENIKKTNIIGKAETQNTETIFRR